jgi:hypothetical protein
MKAGWEKRIWRNPLAGEKSHVIIQILTSGGPEQVIQLGTKAMLPLQHHHKNCFPLAEEILAHATQSVSPPNGSTNHHTLSIHPSTKQKASPGLRGGSPFSVPDAPLPRPLKRYRISYGLSRINKKQFLFSSRLDHCDE